MENNFLPKEFISAHELCFFIHDLLANTLVSGEKQDIFNYEFSLESSGDSCDLIIEVLSKGDYSSVPDYLQKELSISSNSSEKKINGVNWYYYNDETENGEANYYYATIYNEKIYSIKLSLFESGPICISVPDLLNSSLKF